METVRHDDVGEFARLARPLLDADPLRHTVALTVLDGMVRAREPASILLTAHDGAAVVAAVLRSPGYPALVSAVSTAHATAVERALADVDPALPGATGPVPEVEAFAAAHVARTGAAVHVEFRLRLFALGTLAAPVGVPGAPRRAGEADLDLLGGWRQHFIDAVGVRPDPQAPRETAALSLRLGAGVLLWEVDGVPVAQASAQRPVAGMSRIGLVYTPPEHRGRGYAAAVTAAASRWALDSGATRVLLFTDLANATTNALYPRVGYVPVHDALELGFRR